VTEVNPLFPRARISAAELAVHDSVNSRLKSLTEREEQLNQREAVLAKKAYEAGLHKATLQVREKNSVQAAWLSASLASLSREILNNVLSVTGSALQTILSDESSVATVQERLKKLVADTAERNLKIYCSGDTYQHLEAAVSSLCGDDNIAIELRVDEALQPNDLVIEGEEGVIHATVPKFVESAMAIARSRIEAVLDTTLPCQGAGAVSKSAHPVTDDNRVLVRRMALNSKAKAQA
jgi:flagellar biosynthesis/type III secretory pathway protein FliH